MRYVKMLGLAAVAAAALMAFIGASTASATVLCKTTTTPCGSKLAAGAELDFSLETGSTADLTDTGGEPLDECTGSTVKGSITDAGGSSSTVTGPLDATGTPPAGLTWTTCTFPTKTLKVGALEIHHIAGTDNGTVTADGTFEVTINTIFFGSCIYGVTSGTDLGTLTGGEPATMHANAVAEKFSGSNLACPATSLWQAKYVNTVPGGTLHVEPS